MHIEGTYTIETWEQETYDADIPALFAANVGLQFSGGLAGPAQTRYLMTSLEDGSSDFAGQIRVTGSIGERSGTFVMHETGRYDGQQAAMGELRIVPGSGTGDFTGIAGEGAYVASHTESAVEFAGREWAPTPEGIAAWALDVTFD